MKPLRLLLALFGTLLLTACDTSAPDMPRATSDELVNVALSLADHAGAALDATEAAPGTALYEIRKQNPIVAPDGHHVTFAEFTAVRGSVAVECLQGGGTEVRLELGGLIPNGLYTIWNVTFKTPGFDPTFAHLIGLGVVGLPDGSQNTFRASAEGTGRLSTVTAAGSLSMFGTIGGCALADEYEWHVVGAYHLDDQSHGADLGPDGTAVEQFAFIFIQE